MVLGRRILVRMSMKFAQRRTAENIAHELGLEVADVDSRLRQLQGLRLVAQWPDGSWRLTSAGNAERNHVTARPLPFR